MKLISPTIKFINNYSYGLAMIQQAKIASCVSANSEDEDISIQFLQKLNAFDYATIKQFGWVVYKIACDKSASNELMRLGVFSFVNDETAYCNYMTEVTFVIPPWLDIQPQQTPVLQYPRIGCIIESAEDAWKFAMQVAEDSYLIALKNGITLKRAETVLPHSTKTDVVVAGTLLEWITFFKIVNLANNSEQLVQLKKLLLLDIAAKIPTMFDNINNG